MFRLPLCLICVITDPHVSFLIPPVPLSAPSLILGQILGFSQLCFTPVKRVIVYM